MTNEAIPEEDPTQGRGVRTRSRSHGNTFGFIEKSNYELGEERIEEEQCKPLIEINPKGDIS